MLAPAVLALLLRLLCRAYATASAHSHLPLAPAVLHLSSYVCSAALLCYANFYLIVGHSLSKKNHPGGDIQKNCHIKRRLFLQRRASLLKEIVPAKESFPADYLYMLENAQVLYIRKRSGLGVILEAGKFEQQFRTVLYLGFPVNILDVGLKSIIADS